MIDARQAKAEEHGDAAAYLLGALDAAARGRFDAHAAECGECMRELGELQGAADELALSVPTVAPPAHLRQRLLTRAHMTMAESAAPWERRHLAVEESSRQLSPPAVVIRRQGWWMGAQRYSGALAAVSLVVAMASGASAFTSQRQLDEVAQRAEYARAQLNDTLQIVFQPNMVARTLSGMDAAPQATGKVVLAPDRNKAVVFAYSLPPLEKDESYQCWLTQMDDKRFDGGTFRPDERGSAYWVLKTPETMARYRWMSVTKEKGKGGSAPAGPRVLGGQL